MDNVFRGLKVCTKCQEEKPKTEFYLHYSGRSVIATCKPCRVEQIKERKRKLDGK